MNKRGLIGNSTDFILVKAILAFADDRRGGRPIF